MSMATVSVGWNAACGQPGKRGQRLRILVLAILVALLVVPLADLSAQTVESKAVPDRQVTSRALALMDGAARRLQQARTLAATVRIEQSWKEDGRPGKTLSVRASREGNALWEETSWTDDGRRKGFQRVFALRADTAWDYHGTLRQDSVHWQEYSRPVAGVWRTLRALTPALGPFFSSSGDHIMAEMVWLPTRRQDPTLYALVDEPTIEWQGQRVEVVRWVKLQLSGSAPPGSTGGAQDEVIDTARYFIATAPDTTIVRIVSTNSYGWRSDVIVDELNLDGILSPSEMEWTPRADVRQIAAREPLDLDSEAEDASPEDWTLPDFALAAVSPTGAMTTVTLESALAGKQALVLWSWASGCGSCREEFPYFQAIAEEMADRGVAVLAKDYARLDYEREIPEYELASRVLRYNRAPMPILLDPNHNQIDFEKFGRYTTAVVVDADRKVRWAGSARDVPAIRRVLNELAGPR